MNYISILDSIGRTINRLPTKIGTCAVNFSKSRFVKQNWHDTTPTAWKPRSTRRRGSQKRQSGAVLVDSGRLKRSIRLTSANNSRIVISTDVPYAEVHNEGLTATVSVRSFKRRSRAGRPHTVRAHTRKVTMPQRRFIGQSAELCRQIENLIVTEIKQAIK